LLAPELDQLTPIKGHILSFPDVAADDGLVRTADVYLVAQPDRLIAGATMQPGKDDMTVEPHQVEALRERVVALRPDLERSQFKSAVGVRAATPDGLPMVGRTSEKRLLLATGARRNGWLLAPLVAEILLAYLSEEDGGPSAAAMDPARFVTRPSE
jgi:glycine oxidase